jgi:hypothetical protein
MSIHPATRVAAAIPAALFVEHDVAGEPAWERTIKIVRWRSTSSCTERTGDWLRRLCVSERWPLTQRRGARPAVGIAAAHPAARSYRR